MRTNIIQLRKQNANLGIWKNTNKPSASMRDAGLRKIESYARATSAAAAAAVAAVAAVAAADASAVCVLYVLRQSCEGCQSTPPKCVAQCVRGTSCAVAPEPSARLLK